MNVTVTIVVSAPPSEQDLESLRSAASELTNQQNSIRVNIAEDGQRFSLITRFTMKTTAQYKVVDGVSKEFEFWTTTLKGFQDMIISFH